MEKLIQDLYGFHPTSIKKLVGYDNANYLLQNGQNRFVFKTYTYTEETNDLLQAETEILLALQESFQKKIPKPIATDVGDFVTIQRINSRKIICRMLTYIKGEFLGNIPANKQIYASLGRFLAQLDRELISKNNFVISARKWRWDIQ
ncbi:MAG: phosphotransferase, partial [Bacteroidetes bacterium]|nr:phosphotransferase [Bacteroidota bacterium]